MRKNLTIFSGMFTVLFTKSFTIKSIGIPFTASIPELLTTGTFFVEVPLHREIPT